MTAFILTNAASIPLGAKIAMESANALALCAEHPLLEKIMSRFALRIARKSSGRKHSITVIIAEHVLAQLTILLGAFVLTIAKLRHKRLHRVSASHDQHEQCKPCAPIGVLPTFSPQGKSSDLLLAKNVGAFARQKVRTITTMNPSAFDGFVGLAMSNGIKPSQRVGRNSRWQDFTGQSATLESTGQTFDELNHD